MSDDRGSSTGTAEKKEECVKEFIVSDMPLMQLKVC